MPKGNSSALLIVISAPSGAGKTTLCQNLLDSSPAIERAVTCTTRPAREGEVDGRDYYFLSKDDFETRIHQGAFLEHAEVYGRRYGTLKQEVETKLNSGSDVLLNIDVQGAASLRQEAQSSHLLARSMITVFLVTASFAELESRLRGRGQDSEEVTLRRLAAAKEEFEQRHHFDYLLVSDTRAEDLRRMQVLIEAEKLKQSRVFAPSL